MPTPIVQSGGVLPAAAVENLTERMEQIRLRNEQLERKHREAEEDRLAALKNNAMVQVTSASRAALTDDDDEWPRAHRFDYESPAPAPVKPSSPDDVVDLTTRDGATKTSTVEMPLPLKAPAGREYKKFASGQGPPPDPTFNFLADVERDGNKPKRVTDKPAAANKTAAAVPDAPNAAQPDKPRRQQQHRRTGSLRMNHSNAHNPAMPPGFPVQTPTPNLPPVRRPIFDPLTPGSLTEHEYRMIEFRRTAARLERQRLADEELRNGRYAIPAFKKSPAVARKAIADAKNSSGKPNRNGASAGENATTNQKSQPHPYYKHQMSNHNNGNNAKPTPKLVQPTPTVYYSADGKPSVVPLLPLTSSAPPNTANLPASTRQYLEPRPKAAPAAVTVQAPRTKLQDRLNRYRQPTTEAGNAPTDDSPVD